MQSTQQDVVRDRAIRLFTYLRELSTLRSKVVRDTDEYERVLWFDELPAHPTIYSIARGPTANDPDLWIEVCRSDEPFLPDPPRVVGDWLDVMKLRDSAVEPEIRAEITRVGVDGIAITSRLLDQPEIVTMWERYKRDVWDCWAAAHRDWTVRYRCYADLFSIYQQIQKLGEAYELVLSLGLLVWKRPSGMIKRHILCGAAEVGFDPERGILSVCGAGDGVKLHLENDMVEVPDRPANEEEIIRLIDEVSETPWELPKVFSILESWVHSASPRGRFHQQAVAPEISDDPQIAFRPALVLRKRSSRSIIGAFEKIIADLTGGGEIPSEVRRLCTVGDLPVVADANADSSNTQATLPDSVYFPLPANEEQLQIADRVRKASVVLGNDARELGELEESIGGITNRYARYNDQQASLRIETLESKLAAARGRRARSESRVREVCEADTRTYRPVPGYEGSPAQIAKLLDKDRERFSWFLDRPQDDDELNVDVSRLPAVLDGLRRFPAEASAELLRPTIDLASLMSASEFAEKVAAAKADAHKVESRRAAGKVEDDLSRIPRGARAELVAAIRAVLTASAALLCRDLSWVARAHADVLTGREGRWWQLHSDSAKALTRLGHSVFRIQEYEVKLPDRVDHATLLADSTDLLAYLRAGGSLGFWVFRAKVVKRTEYLVRDVRVNGRPASTPEALEQLIDYLRAGTALRQACAIWAGITQPIAHQMVQQVRELHEYHERLTEVLAFHDAVQNARHHLTAHLVEFPRWSDPEAVALLMERLESADLCEDLQRQQAELETFSAVLARQTADPRRHPAVKALASSAASLDPERYAAAVAMLEQIQSDAAAIHARNDFLAGARHQLPMLVASLMAEPDRDDWQERLAAMPVAWTWARVSAWLDKFDRSHQISEIEASHRRASSEIATTLAELAAERAWQHCFRRMTEEQRQHLVSWGKVVKKIGKTSKYAVQRRKEAQAHMDKCRPAVPAWIMPFHRVAETIAPVPEQFDVVIVDEASQSGPETLLLTYIAKQMIIVGDDKQIAPEYVGVDQDVVNQLIHRHLPDFDLGNTFGLGFSLFEHGEIRYGNRIVLREHFRCMPEIIRFSNDLSYRETPLIPLRQYPAARLEPILVRHLETGYREGGSGHAINRPEADAIVDEIIECCSNPRYDGKTIGVISLQGETQAQLIERELVKRLPPKDIAQRRIVCGDAYAFQGDERDIIFLSLVAAPNERIGPLTKETDQRRFNVAASRAKDQMWLFHTVQLQDLNPSDMRARLLHYMQHPTSTVYQEPDFDRCESEFERDVARALYARNYRFYLQYEPFGPGGRRIDIVVEGAKARLAVECDGDHWHGPDRWDADMSRQRQLERCGWTFWRVRGSEFYKDRAAALTSLWSTFDRVGILPGAVDPGPRPASAPIFSLNGDLRDECHPRVTDSSFVAADIVDDDAVNVVHPRNEGPIDREECGEVPLGGLQLPIRIPDPPAQPSEGGKSNRPFFPLENDVDARAIDAVTQSEIRAVFEALLREHPKIPREEFLHLATSALGFRRLGKSIRKRLNRAIGADIRAGRLKNDWEYVERAR